MPCSMCCVWLRWLPVTHYDYPCRQTVHHYFRRLDGTWERIHDKLYQLGAESVGTGCVPSAVVLDSQSAETATMVFVSRI